MIRIAITALFLFLVSPVAALFAEDFNWGGLAGSLGSTTVATANSPATAFTLGGDMKSASRVNSLPSSFFGDSSSPHAEQASSAMDNGNEDGVWVIAALCSLFLCGLGIIGACFYVQRRRAIRVATPMVLVG